MENEPSAIHCVADKGPCFGNGHDIQIRDKSNEEGAGADEGNYNNVCYTYKFSFDYGDWSEKDTLCGAELDDRKAAIFITKGYEVFNIL